MGKHSHGSRRAHGRKSSKSVTRFSDPGLPAAAHTGRPSWGDVATWTAGYLEGELAAYAAISAAAARGRHAAERRQGDAGSR